MYFNLNQKLGLKKHEAAVMDADLIEDYAVIIDVMNEKPKNTGG